MYVIASQFGPFGGAMNSSTTQEMIATMPGARD
jgi:hypothetical protein